MTEAIGVLITAYDVLGWPGVVAVAALITTASLGWLCWKFYQKNVALKRVLRLAHSRLGVKLNKHAEREEREFMDNQLQKVLSQSHERHLRLLEHRAQSALEQQERNEKIETLQAKIKAIHNKHVELQDAYLELEAELSCTGHDKAILQHVIDILKDKIEPSDVSGTDHLGEIIRWISTRRH